MAGCKIEEVPKTSPDRKSIAISRTSSTRPTHQRETRERHSGWLARHRINLILAHQTQRHSVSQFRVQTHQTGIIDERLFPDPAAA
jgi:hypothetical protein